MSGGGPGESERSGSSSGPRAAGAPAPALALRAQPRPELALREPPHPGPVAGLPAVLNALRYTGRTAGIVRGARALLGVNQREGFDCPGCAWPDPEHRAMAEFCENGARAVAHEADRRKVDARFFAAHPLALLRQQSDHWLEKQGRLVEPMIKRPGATHYEPIAYDEAFALVGAALTRLASPDEAAFYTSGRASNEAAFLYQLFARSYGTNNLPDCSNMCHESSGKGLGSTIGVGKGTVSLADFELADCILILGQNPGTNHPRMLPVLAAAAQRGAKILSVNPMRERALESFAHPQTPAGLLGIGKPISTHYVQLKINGDVAFLKGVMKELFAMEAEGREVFDHAFLREHTTGFEAFAEALAEQGFDELEASSGVARNQMREVAEIYASSRATIACWAMGLTQHKNGVANVRELMNLLLLRGNVGRPGAGPCPVRGHSNVQGDRTMGIYEAPSEEFLARLDRAVGIRSPRAHGHDVVGTIDALEKGEVKVLVALGGNLVAAGPDTERMKAALAKAELSVQIATKLNRSHVETADTALLLPCLGRTEIDARPGGPAFVTVENSMSVVHRSEGRLAPASPELLSEPEIVARIAAATLGAKTPVDWRWLAEDYDRIRELIEKAIPGFERYNERVREPEGFVLPSRARERRFDTASGKAELTVQRIPRHELAPDQLLLMTIRTHDQFNTTVYDLDDRYRGIYGERRVVLLSRAELEARGLEGGELVDLTSYHGDQTRKLEAFRAVAYDLPPGCAAAYFPEANPLVVLEHHADESRTPASKSIVIRVTKHAP